MRIGIHIGSTLCVLAASAAGCAALAGIEDLQLTGSPDAATDVTVPVGDGAGSSGGDGASGAESGADVVATGACTQGQVRCAGNAVQSCAANGQWGPPVDCKGQTCVAGACSGTCSPGQTNPVPCGHCGTDTQTCSATGGWQPSGTCSSQGACAPSSSQACNTYGTQTCTASCAWGACSCPAAAVCQPAATQCSGTAVQTCDACGQWGPPVSCASGTCQGGVCTGICTAWGRQTQCSGNGVQPCVGGQWGTPVACTNQTCQNGACVGSCAPGQTHPVPCGNCGTDTQSCGSGGTWQPSGTCAGQGACAPNAKQACNTYGTETCSASCAWGACSCGPNPVCTPNATQCSGSSVQTCSACGQWGNPVPCGAGMTCTGTGTCAPAPTDCPGSFLLCDGFEGGSISSSRWSLPNQGDARQTITVDTAFAHRGTYALHVHVNALNDGSYLSSMVKETSTFPHSVLYLRAWVLLNAYTNVADTGLVLVQSTANGQSASGGMGIMSNGVYWSGVSNSGGFDFLHQSGATLPTGLSSSNWTCIEQMIDTSYTAPNTDGLMQVWHGTVSSPDGALTGTAKLQSMESVLFGTYFTPPSGGTPSPAIELYFDDIAIDTSYIDCNQ